MIHKQALARAIAQVWFDQDQCMCLHEPTSLILKQTKCAFPKSNSQYFMDRLSVCDAFLTPNAPQTKYSHVSSVMCTVFN